MSLAYDEYLSEHSSLLSYDDYAQLVRSLIFSALTEFGFKDTKLLNEFSFKQYYSAIYSKQIFDVSFRGHSAQFEIHLPGVETYDRKFADKLKIAVYNVIKPTLWKTLGKSKKYNSKRLEVHKKLKEPIWLKMHL